MSREIIEELEALALHYLRPVRTPEQHARALQDYLTDLGDLPVAAIKSGCAAWRKSGAKKYPTPGELRSMATQFAPTHNGPKARKWEPITDAEYATYSLRDKIRHQTILGDEALAKAGPMWRNGGPLTREDMGAAWHQWREAAANHYAEAKRLRETLAEVERRA